MNNRKTNNQKVKNLVGVGIFAALAIVVSFATQFIKIGYLSLDAGDIIIVLSSFIYGPISGVLISLVSSLVSFFYSGTGPWGLIMDFCSSAVFASVAAVIYKSKKTFTSAIIGIYAAVVAVTAVMMPLNILITPLYTPGVTREFVLREIPVMLLPFNFSKALFNGGAVLLMYKPLVRALRKAGFVKGNSADSATERPLGVGLTRTTLTATVVGGVSVLVATVGLVLLAVL